MKLTTPDQMADNTVTFEYVIERIENALNNSPKGQDSYIIYLPQNTKTHHDAIVTAYKLAGWGGARVDGGNLILSYDKYDGCDKNSMLYEDFIRK